MHRFQHTIVLPSDIEAKWERIHVQEPTLSFNRFVNRLIAHAHETAVATKDAEDPCATI